MKLLAAALATRVDGAMFPDAYANYELSLAMFFENLDYVGSIQYAYAAAVRAFNAPPAKVCNDGRAVEPVLQHQCPLPTAIAELEPCSEVKVDELCKDAKDCGWSEPAGNCPIDSVYKKVEEGCRGHGAAFCSAVAKAIAMGSTFSMALAVSLPSSCVTQLLGPRVWVVVQESTCVMAVYIGVLWPVCWVVGGNGATITFWVMTAILVFLSIGHPVSVDDLRNGAPDTRRTMMMAIPVLNVYAAWKMGAENAVETRTTIGPVCRALRIVGDIPEVVFSCLDMYFFGISWFAVFDLVTSTMEVAYHLIGVSCKLLYYLMVAVISLMWCLCNSLKDAKAALDDSIVEPSPAPSPATEGAAS
eukprot:CAMPEP_0172807338 /NCGR_PEP_ID=MMETSP1075-20121228/6938_1 /TAXON_ID=2916 /ORGANISM="Ceratium fusus, Strain PA161109" /LENGTH=358 /DNA_ID=CAMNT_0013646307 /DNA_START=141 /DNA_END=1217 /DNA_ORIENTATION=+